MNGWAVALLVLLGINLIIVLYRGLFGRKAVTGAKDGVEAFFTVLVWAVIGTAEVLVYLAAFGVIWK